MSHAKKNLHQQKDDPPLTEKESDKQFFLILGVTVVTLAIALMTYYLFRAAFFGAGGGEKNETRTAVYNDAVTRHSKEIDYDLQNFSFSQNEKVRLVVGFTTPNSSEVLDDLQTGEYTVTRFYWNEPVFAVEVTESGYQKLMNSTHVNTIKLDRESKSN
jgi:hypothetical protein